MSEVKKSQQPSPYSGNEAGNKTGPLKQSQTSTKYENTPSTPKVRSYPAFMDLGQD